MLNDFDNWPLEEVCIEAKAAIPISMELEAYIRAKYILIKEVSIPSYISTNMIDYQLIMNAADNIERNNGLDIDIPSLNNYLD